MQKEFKVDPISEFDHILACLGEECGEVQQIVGKTQRFGIYDHHPLEGNSNFEKMRAEVHDILATFEMVCDKLGEEMFIDKDAIQAKKDRVHHYMKYSRDVGRLK